ncbi:hypothetical protein VaNZ11_000953 [Volvox africanus]|uniref:Uncharacterized protein n=1 Tax=Volvox africanus TaxID=51714 RepID=A0ABQ5RQ00_9CHLO|nr:hypothetical protein VaNZ11_000953 [Volvox africanus]
MHKNQYFSLTGIHGSPDTATDENTELERALKALPTRSPRLIREAVFKKLDLPSGSLPGDILLREACRWQLAEQRFRRAATFRTCLRALKTSAVAVCSLDSATGAAHSAPGGTTLAVGQQTTHTAASGGTNTCKSGSQSMYASSCTAPLSSRSANAAAAATQAPFESHTAADMTASGVIVRAPHIQSAHGTCGRCAVANAAAAASTERRPEPRGLPPPPVPSPSRTPEGDRYCSGCYSRISFNSDPDPDPDPGEKRSRPPPPSSPQQQQLEQEERSPCGSKTSWSSSSGNGEGRNDGRRSKGDDSSSSSSSSKRMNPDSCNSSGNGNGKDCNSGILSSTSVSGVKYDNGDATANGNDNGNDFCGKTLKPSTATQSGEHQLLSQRLPTTQQQQKQNQQRQQQQQQDKQQQQLKQPKHGVQEGRETPLKGLRRGWMLSPRGTDSAKGLCQKETKTILTHTAKLGGNIPDTPDIADVTVAAVKLDASGGDVAADRAHAPVATATAAASVTLAAADSTASNHEDLNRMLTAIKDPDRPVNRINYTHKSELSAELNALKANDARPPKDKWAAATAITAATNTAVMEDAASSTSASTSTLTSALTSSSTSTSASISGLTSTSTSSMLPLESARRQLGPMVLDDFSTYPVHQLVTWMMHEAREGEKLVGPKMPKSAVEFNMNNPTITTNVWESRVAAFLRSTSYHSVKGWEAPGYDEIVATSGLLLYHDVTTPLLWNELHAVTQALRNLQHKFELLSGMGKDEGLHPRLTTMPFVVELTCLALATPDFFLTLSLGETGLQAVISIHAKVMSEVWEVITTANRSAAAVTATVATRRGGTRRAGGGSGRSRGISLARIWDEFEAKYRDKLKSILPIVLRNDHCMNGAAVAEATGVLDWEQRLGNERGTVVFLRAVGHVLEAMPDLLFRGGLSRGRSGRSGRGGGCGEGGGSGWDGGSGSGGCSGNLGDTAFMDITSWRQRLALGRKVLLMDQGSQGQLSSPPLLVAGPPALMWSMQLSTYVGVARHLGTPHNVVVAMEPTPPAAAVAAAAAPTAAALVGRKGHQDMTSAPAAAATVEVLAANESELEDLRRFFAVQVTTNQALQEKHMPQAHDIPVLSLQLLPCPSRLYKCLSQAGEMMGHVINWNHPKDLDNAHPCEQPPVQQQKLLKRVADSLRARQMAVIGTRGEWAFHSVVVMMAKHRQDLILGADRDLLLVPWVPSLDKTVIMQNWVLHMLHEMYDVEPLRGEQRPQQQPPPRAIYPHDKMWKEHQSEGRVAFNAFRETQSQQWRSPEPTIESRGAGGGEGMQEKWDGDEIGALATAAQQGKLTLRADWRIRRRTAMMVAMSGLLELFQCENAVCTFREPAQEMELLQKVKTCMMKTPPLLLVLDCAKGGGDIRILQTTK